MSSTSIKAQYNGRPVKITMGYDNQNQGYFMVIEPEEDDNPDADEESGLIYSNLDDLPFPGVSSSIEHYKKVLREKNIDVNPEYFGRVLAEAD